MASYPTQLIKQAMGTRAQDILTIANAWATATIRLEDGWYCVDGILDAGPFARIQDALDHVFAELAAYQCGRAD